MNKKVSRRQLDWPGSACKGVSEAKGCDPSGRSGLYIITLHIITFIYDAMTTSGRDRYMYSNMCGQINCTIVAKWINNDDNTCKYAQLSQAHKHTRTAERVLAADVLAAMHDSHVISSL